MTAEGGEIMKKVTKIEAVQQPLNNNRTRVVAYCRVSTDSEEQLGSLESQVAHYDQLIDSHPEWDKVGIYSDDGITGTNMDKRPGLQSLIDDCKQLKIDLVLIKSISRFSRNILECLTVVRELSALKIAIHFDKENLNKQQMDGELLLSSMSILAENESRTISENIKWSLRKRVENNSYRHISAPYGYKVINNNLEIDEKEARIIQDIFEGYLAGKGTYRIANKLNSKDITPPRKEIWRDSTILYILTNERYVGDFLYQKTYTDSEFQRHVNDGDVDMLYIPDNHEAIISREDFEKVKDLLSNRSETKVSRGNTVYPLTKKIICGHCGSNYKRRIHYSTNQSNYIAWCCPTHISNKEQCPMKFIKETDIQAAFMTMINKLIFAREELIEETIDAFSETSFVTQNRLNLVEEKIMDCQNNIQTLTELNSSGLIDVEFYHQYLNRMEQEKKNLLNEKRTVLEEDENKLIRFQELKKLNQFLKRRNPFNEYEDNVLSEFLERVKVENRETFHFYLKCGLRFTERSSQ